MNCPMCQAPVPEGRTICPACGWTLTNTLDDSLPIGTLLKNGQLRIERKLGQGGFGITYLANDLTLGRTVAVKELFQSDWRRQGKLVQSPLKLPANEFQDIKDKFLVEARVLAGFNDPSIVQVYDQFSENNTAYLVMEYLQGESLADRLDRVKTIPPGELIPITEHLAQALRLLHAKGQLHRDIKPDNIILEKGGRTVLIDFGSVRQFQAGKTIHMTRLVTPGYAPLEQYAASGKVGPPTDLYALGATLYHALSGNMPPSASDLLNGVRLPPLPLGTPGGLAVVVQAAMQVRMQDRPQTVDDFLSLLTSAPDARQSLPPFTGPKPVLDYLKYLGISPNTFQNRLEEGIVQVSELPPEVRADLIRMQWINAQGLLTFRYNWVNQPRQQPPKPIGPTPSPSPPPKKPSSPSPTQSPTWTPHQPPPTPAPSPPPVAFPDAADVNRLWGIIHAIPAPANLVLNLPYLPAPRKKITYRTFLRAILYALFWSWAGWAASQIGFGFLSFVWILFAIGGAIYPFMDQGDTNTLAQITEVDRRIRERQDAYEQAELSR